ncbi:hypothetical protein [uncultured Kordia sp.]|uniref:hypothetical protein n=1 Tax=uncultured Kordia sp. TaxID=507699 RepID=UPI0026169158|nr:hypothetical protein [uncultured Kordia sp.]
MTKTIIQEILKVFIIAYVLIVLGGLLFLFVESFSRDTTADTFDYILLVIAFITGILAVIFHVKTYRYYSKIKRKRNIPKLYWIAALIFPSCIAYLIYETFVNFFYATNASIEQDMNGFIIFMIILFFSLLSVVEVLLMFQRVQKRHENLSLEQELENIGDNSIL